MMKSYTYVIIEFMYLDMHCNFNYLIKRNINTSCLHIVNKLVKITKDFKIWLLNAYNLP